MGEGDTWLASRRQGSSPKAAPPWQLNMRASTLPLGSGRIEEISFHLSASHSITFLSTPAKALLTSAHFGLQANVRGLFLFFQIKHFQMVQLQVVTLYAPTFFRQ